MIKFTFPLGMTEFIDILKVQLPIAEFLEPVSDILCNPLFPSFKRTYKKGSIISKLDKPPAIL